MLAHLIFEKRPYDAEPESPGLWDLF